MSKDVRTHEANLEMVSKFLQYAHIANASYAMLHYLLENTEDDKNNKIYKADGLTFKDKLEKDVSFTDKKNNITYIKKAGTNTAYACAIEARFNRDKVGDWCLPDDKCLTTKDKIPNNDITKVTLDFKLSKDTIEFTNRYELLAHESNRKQTRKIGYYLREYLAQNRKNKGYSMQKLKKFYKIYTIIVGLLSLFAMVVIGPNGMSLGETLFAFAFYMPLPILFYGTFIFFSNKTFKKKESKQLSEEEMQGEDVFRLFFVTLAISIFGLFVMNRLGE